MINPSTGYYTRTMFTPLGLLSIGTYLQQYGHTVRIYDRCVDNTKLNKVVNDFSPEIVGVSVMSSRGLKDAVRISKKLKEYGLTVVWGGQLPSLQTELVLKNDYVDIVSVGEGEVTWRELLECSSPEDYAHVLGIAYKKDGKIVCTPCRPFLDLATLPTTDWSLIDVPKYMQTYLGYHKMMYLYSSKGCPGNCAFCVNVNFHKSTYRKRPNDVVIEEIKYLIEHFGLEGFYFSDELWCVKRSDVRDFCTRVLDEGLQIRWGIDLRIGMYTEEDFRLMYQAGCRWIFFGIESGSKEMIRCIHKRFDYDQVKPIIKMLNGIGYTTIASFILGFPDETEDQLRDTVRLINEIDANLIPIWHFTPIPGTELYEKLVKEGRYREPEKLEDLFSVVATESIGTNYSCVPDRDLKVIRSWYHWKSFTNKNAIRNGKSFEFAKETIVSGLRSISMKGFVSFFVNGFLALNEFLYVFYYAHMFPDIRKKYDLR